MINLTRLAIMFDTYIQEREKTAMSFSSVQDSCCDIVVSPLILTSITCYILSDFIQHLVITLSFRAQVALSVMNLFLRVGNKNNSYIRETQENSIENFFTN